MCRRTSSSAALAATELDVNSMSLKEVIRWSNARERVMLAEERRLRVWPLGHQGLGCASRAEGLSAAGKGVPLLSAVLRD